MLRRAASRSALVVAAAALVWVGVGAGTATAAEVVEVGWWSRNPLSSAPEGGFAVGAAPDGPSAVAAVRIDLAGGVDTLVLDVVPTTDAGSLGSLQVCIGPDNWTAAARGALDDAPATTCEADPVPFGPAGERWRADASSLVQGSSGEVTLVVVPAPGTGTVPFEVGFERPSLATTGAAPAPTPPGGGPGAAPDPTPSPEPGPGPSVGPGPGRPSVAGSPIALGGGGAATVTVPAAPMPEDTGAPAETEEPTDDEAASTFDLADAGLLEGVSTSEPRWGEAFVLVLIGAGVGLAVYGTSRVSAARA